MTICFSYQISRELAGLLQSKSGFYTFYHFLGGGGGRRVEEGVLFISHLMARFLDLAPPPPHSRSPTEKPGSGPGSHHTRAVSHCQSFTFILCLSIDSCNITSVL